MEINKIVVNSGKSCYPALTPTNLKAEFRKLLELKEKDRLVIYYPELQYNIKAETQLVELKSSSIRKVCRKYKVHAEVLINLDISECRELVQNVLDKIKLSKGGQAPKPRQSNKKEGVDPAKATKKSSKPKKTKESNTQKKVIQTTDSDDSIISEDSFDNSKPKNLLGYDSDAEPIINALRWIPAPTEDKPFPECPDPYADSDDDSVNKISHVYAHNTIKGLKYYIKFENGMRRWVAAETVIKLKPLEKLGEYHKKLPQIKFGLISKRWPDMEKTLDPSYLKTGVRLEIEVPESQLALRRKAMDYFKK